MSELTSSTNYSLHFVNNSANPGSFAVFQQSPDMGVSDVMSLAWMTRNTHPGVQGTFNWTTDYDFVWAETGALTPGIQVFDTQIVNADLSTSNAITLSHDNDGYVFKDQAEGTPQGSLYIKNDSSVPLNRAAVGIGMAGAPTFMVQAQPNMNMTFTPRPEYWVAFGHFMTGEVLDVQDISNAVKVDFPPGTNAMKVTLNPDNTFTVEPAFV